MDELTLTKWKSQLEAELTELEKKSSTLEMERGKTIEQLGAVMKLLSMMKGEDYVDIPSNKSISADKAATAFIAGLKLLGWSVSNGQGGKTIYNASRGNQNTEIQLIFSKYYEASDNYWFGIDPGSLENRSSQKGGVVIILGAMDRYLCLPFAKLLQLLKGSNKTRVGRWEFHVREKSGQFYFHPLKTDAVNVSSFYNDLSKIGLN
jgi:hypothetical protein